MKNSETAAKGNYWSDGRRLFLSGELDGICKLPVVKGEDRTIINFSKLTGMSVAGLSWFTEYLKFYDHDVLFEDCTLPVLYAMRISHACQPRDGLDAILSILIPWRGSDETRKMQRLSISQCLVWLEGIDFSVAGQPAHADELKDLLTGLIARRQPSIDDEKESRIHLLVHDIRQCLRTMEGFAYEFNENRRPAIGKQIRRINGLLDMLKQKEGRATACYPWTLDYLASEYQEAFKKKDRMLQVSGSNITASLCVDSQRLEQIVANLLSNALEASHSTAWISWQVVGGCNLSIEIEDDGDGIPAHLQDNLFQEAMTYGKTQGTGTGLKGAYDLAVAIGGRLEFVKDSARTRFLLSIPGAFESGAIKKKVLLALSGDEVFSHFRSISESLLDRYLIHVIRDDRFNQKFDYDILISNDAFCIEQAMSRGLPYLFAGLSLTTDSLAESIASQLNEI